MPAFIDLSRQTFGRLTAHMYVGKRQWQCHCECGNTLIVRADHLKDGATLSCGCLRTAEDLTGRRFGAWLVISRETNNLFGTPMYQCRCDCGSLKIHQTSNLLSGSTKSCGCLSYGTDYVGQHYGRLTVLMKLKTSHGQPVILVCSCTCGNHTRVLATNVVNGRTQSCGCLNKEKARGQRFTQTHGLSRSRVYSIWAGMRQRCYNPNASNYSLYGGSGVIVCRAWKSSFERFYKDVGDPPSPKHSLDRFPDPTGPYAPHNVRWATAKQQANNRRITQYLTFANQRLTIPEWADLTQIPVQRLRSRLSYGWPIERALTEPVKHKNPTI